MTGIIVALVLIGLYWTLLYRGVSLAVFTGVTAAAVVLVPLTIALVVDFFRNPD